MSSSKNKYSISINVGHTESIKWRLGKSMSSPTKDAARRPTHLCTSLHIRLVVVTLRWWRPDPIRCVTQGVKSTWELSLSSN